MTTHIYKNHIENFNEFTDQLNDCPLMNNYVGKYSREDSTEIYINNDYLKALRTANKYLYAWMTRNGKMAYGLISDNVKKQYKNRKDFEAAFAGTSNPHNESFKIIGCRCRSKDRIGFEIWIYYHYTGQYLPPYKRPAKDKCIELVKINEETWLVDKILNLA